MTDDPFIDGEIMDEIREYLENYKNKDSERESTVVEDAKSEDSIYDEFEKIISDINKEIQTFISKKDYTRAERFISVVKRLEKLKDKVLKTSSIKHMSTKAQNNRGYVGEKSSHRLITPQEEYYIPILEALYELGGKGKVQEVIQRVGLKMKDILTSRDYEYLPSGRTIRWENRTQWARLDLVNKGLLKKDSPRGIWELSEEGYKYIEKLKKKDKDNG
ncbi:MAG: winged helix-turn-helix domain-containing protein [bacterium]